VGGELGVSGSRGEGVLARRFREYVLADVDYLRTRGYDPAGFLGMLARSSSAVAVVRQLFADPRHTSYGFERLWEIRELGHSIEFAANLPWFRSLFTDDELDEARCRLILHEFPADERLAAAAAHPPKWAAE
jgi:hypothetical protein